jgi:hypothetical protein
MAQQAQRKEKAAASVQAPPEAAPTPGPDGAPTRWQKPRSLTAKGWGILGGVLLLLNFPLLHYTLLRGEAEAGVALPFSDDFSQPSTVERHYFSTGGHWRVVDGQLLSPGVKNNPLWLKASLPANVAVEFDVRSEGNAGDIKVELFGDGTDHASGYVFIHGGWNNSLSIIARLDEHGTSLQKLEAAARRVARERALPEAGLVKTGVFQEGTRMRVEAHPFPVTRGQTYRWRIERREGHIRWLIDGKPFMDFKDPLPLVGRGHDRFGFSSWDSDLFFDNLQVTPL